MYINESLSCVEYSGIAGLSDAGRSFDGMYIDVTSIMSDSRGVELPIQYELMGL